MAHKRRIEDKISPGRRPKFKYGDIVHLKPGAKVTISGTGEPVPRKIIDDGRDWAVDDYIPETGMLNLNRVLHPYPGAFCSWVHESDVIED